MLLTCAGHLMGFAISFFSFELLLAKLLTMGRHRQRDRWNQNPPIKSLRASLPLRTNPRGVSVRRIRHHTMPATPWPRLKLGKGIPHPRFRSVTDPKVLRTLAAITPGLEGTHRGGQKTRRLLFVEISVRDDHQRFVPMGASRRWKSGRGWHNKPRIPKVITSSQAGYDVYLL